MIGTQKYGGRNGHFAAGGILLGERSAFVCLCVYASLYVFVWREVNGGYGGRVGDG